MNALKFIHYPFFKEDLFGYLFYFRHQLKKGKTESKFCLVPWWS